MVTATTPSKIMTVMQAIIAVQPSAWAFGWDTMIAIGTFCLAIATVALAWKTAKLARASAEDVAAQDRPVLVPAPEAGSAPNPDYTADSLSVEIVNAGRGAALDVHALVMSKDVSTAASPWNKAAIPAGERTKLSFQGVEMISHSVTVHLQYRDIADKVHTSDIIMDREQDERSNELHLRFADTVVDAGGPDVQLPASAEAHPASRAVATEWIRRRWLRYKRRWLLK